MVKYNQPKVGVLIASGPPKVPRRVRVQTKSIERTLTNYEKTDFVPGISLGTVCGGQGVYTAISCSPWKGQDGAILGTRVETVITKDETDYGDPNVTNRFEKVTLKVTFSKLLVTVGSP